MILYVTLTILIVGLSMLWAWPVNWFTSLGTFILVFGIMANISLINERNKKRER